MRMDEQLAQIAHSDQNERAFQQLARNIATYHRALREEQLDEELVQELTLQINEIYAEVFFGITSE